MNQSHRKIEQRCIDGKGRGRGKERFSEREKE